MGFLGGFIVALHKTIGISPPPPDKVRFAVRVWIVSMIVIAVVFFLLLRYAL